MSRAVLSRRLLLVTAVSAPLASWSHDGSHREPRATHSMPAEQKPFGIAGKLKEQSRTVFIDMGDDMRFKPDRIEVTEGQTLRFIFRNKGRLMHEWVLGEDLELKRHAEAMRQNPDMHHEEPHMVHVPPGRSGEIVWRFNRPGTFKFACLIPGHFDAGMVGTVTVRPVAQSKR